MLHFHTQIIAIPNVNILLLRMRTWILKSYKESREFI